MKRVLIIAVMVVLALSCVSAQDAIYYESTPTLQWDAVTTDSEGNAFLADDTVEYEVYVWDAAGGDVTTQTVDALTLVGTVGATEYQLSFPYRAEWVAAVRVKHTDGGGNVVFSALSYSTVTEDVATSPFAYIPVLTWVPGSPGNLRDSGM